MKRALTLITVTALPLIAACGGSQPAPAASHAPASASAIAARHASADCSKLSASPFPPAAYDQLVTREVTRLASGGNAPSALRRRARSVIAREIRTACPQFASLTRG